MRPGSYTFTLKVEDSGTKPNGYHCEGYVYVTINGTNQAPTFTKGPDVTVLEDAPAYSAAWASNISPGGTADAGQTLAFTVTNDNNGLFSVQPTIAADGKLSFTPKANANGAANVNVYLKDNGGTANSGNDTSSTVNFVITVTAVDDIETGPAYLVTSTDWTGDGSCTEGNCTLREAITAANADGVASTIDLAAGATYTVAGVDNNVTGTGPNGLPQITTPITINGHGAIITRSTAVAAARFFYIAKGASLTLNEIQLQNGSLTSDPGGAILNDGTLAVSNSLLQYNTATKGGALYNGGTASLYNNTFYLNTSGEGAVYTAGPFSMYSTTLLNNALSGAAPVTSPTALVLATCGSTSCVLFNNLLVSSSSASPLCTFMVTSLSGAGNLATDSTCKFFGTPTTYDLVKMSTPASNGGPTKTAAITAGSTAIDVGYTDPGSTEGCKNPNLKNRDQRGYYRVADGNADSVAVCDLGAFEYNSTAPPPTGEHETNPPQVTVVLAPPQPDGLNGWYRQPVTLAVEAVDDREVKEVRCALDPGSPPAAFDDLPAGPCPHVGGAMVSADGEHSFYAAATDVFGNTSDVTSTTFNIDATAPVITCPMAGPFAFGSGEHAVGPAGVDAGISGLDESASVLSGMVLTNTIGPHTLILKAVDLAGNERLEGCAYNVVAAFGGLYPPVEAAPEVNRARAGSAVPVKFSLGGDSGLKIVAAGYPASYEASCTDFSAAGPQQATSPAGKSELSYSQATGQYSYEWKTDQAWAGQCRVLTLQLVDGTRRQAYFQFR